MIRRLAPLVALGAAGAVLWVLSWLLGLGLVARGAYAQCPQGFSLAGGLCVATIPASGLSGAVAIVNGGTSATSAGAGQIPNTTSGTASSWTSTPTLGASGTPGSLTFGNATSGTVTVQPVTGTLGTVIASLPANSGTLAELNLAQTWTATQTFGTITPTNIFAQSVTESPNYWVTGAPASVSGCSNSSTAGGATAGIFTSGTSGTCTVTVTLATAANGWACSVWDTTTTSDTVKETGFTTGSVTFSGTTVSGDVIAWSCTGF